MRKWFKVYLLHDVAFTDQILFTVYRILFIKLKLTFNYLFKINFTIPSV